MGYDTLLESENISPGTSTDGPDVSVVIPCFNYGEFLEECLSSVYAQSGVRVEIIVVDDGSTDNTRETLEKHKERIRAIYQHNLGACAARNTGLAAATGKYVVLLDADDLLARKCLQAKLNALAGCKPNTIVVGQVRAFTNGINRAIPSPLLQWRSYFSNIEVSLSRQNVAPPAAYMFPRRLFEHIGGFDEELRGCEDYDFFLRALAAGYGFKYCPKSITLHRKHGFSLSAKKHRSRAFPYDVLLHKRKLNGYYGPKLDAIIQTTPGKLAFIEGLFITYFAIDAESNPEGKSFLFSAIEEQLSTLEVDNIATVREYEVPELSTEILLYLARLCLYRNRVDFRETDIAKRLDEYTRLLYSRPVLLQIFRRMIPWNTNERIALLASMMRHLRSKLSNLVGRGWGGASV
jgi:glycosyltransferase involved in cell wall biosynthesis